MGEVGAKRNAAGTIHFPRAKVIPEGLAFVDHIRDVLEKKTVNLPEETLEFYARLLVLYDGMLNAQDYEQWKRWNGQYALLGDRFGFNKDVRKAIETRKTDFRSSFEAQRTIEDVLRPWVNKIFPEAGRLIEQDENRFLLILNRLKQVGSRAYYNRLRWTGVQAKNGGNTQAEEESKNKRCLFLLGEFDYREIEEGLQFYLEMREAIEEKPTPMSSDQLDFYVSLVVVLTGMLEAADEKECTWWKWQCAHWTNQTPYGEDSQKAKDLIAARKSAYLKKLRAQETIPRQSPEHR